MRRQEFILSTSSGCSLVPIIEGKDNSAPDSLEVLIAPRSGSLIVKKKILILSLFWALLSGQSKQPTKPTAIAGSAAATTDYFSTVCATPQVVRCEGFESNVAQDVSGVYADPGQDADNGGNGGFTHGFVDTALAASGNSSFHFVIPAFAPQDSSGSVHLDFSSTLSTSFGQGQEFYVQWRQNMDTAYLTNTYLNGSSCPPPDGTARVNPSDCPGDAFSGGMKQIIIGPQDTSLAQTQSGKHWSCEVPHLVVTMDLYRQIPTMYHSCGLYEPFQPAYLPPAQSYPNYLNQSAVACGGVLTPGVVAPDPCVKYVANQWQTVQIHVKVGHWYLVSPTTLQGTYNYRRDSQVDMWLAQDNQPSVLVQSMVFYSLHNYASDASSYQPGSPYNYGKVWLLPYNTFRDPNAGPYPVANIWYDNVVISSARVPDPGVSIQPATDLTASAANYPSVTLSWTRNANVGGSYGDTNTLIERCPGQIYDCEAGALAGLSWTQIGSVPAGGTSYTDSAAATGIVYTYRVRTTNGSSYSAYSNPATNLPAPPSDLAVVRASSTSAQLTWTDNSDSESQFAIERCTGVFEYYKANGTSGQSYDSPNCLTTTFENGGTETVPFSEVARVPGVAGTGGVVTYKDTTLTAGKSYTYRVRSLSPAGSMRSWNSGHTAYTGNVMPLASTASNGSACDLNGDGQVNLQDVQLAVTRVTLGVPCSSSMTSACTITNVQQIVNATITGTCNLH